MPFITIYHQMPAAAVFDPLNLGSLVWGVQ
jgi:hypothetical protein